MAISEEKVQMKTIVDANGTEYEVSYSPPGTLSNPLFYEGHDDWTTLTDKATGAKVYMCGMSHNEQDTANPFAEGLLPPGVSLEDLRFEPGQTLCDVPRWMVEHDVEKAIDAAERGETSLPTKLQQHLQAGRVSDFWLRNLLGAGVKIPAEFLPAA